MFVCLLLTDCHTLIIEMLSHLKKLKIENILSDWFKLKNLLLPIFSTDFGLDFSVFVFFKIFFRFGCGFTGGGFIVLRLFTQPPTDRNNQQQKMRPHHPSLQNKY